MMDMGRLDWILIGGTVAVCVCCCGRLLSENAVEKLKVGKELIALAKLSPIPEIIF